MGKELKFISADFYKEYADSCITDLTSKFRNLSSKFSFSAEDFEYYFIASSIYSSKIEGNTLDANSFFRNRNNKSFPKIKEVQEIEGLVRAYQFASENQLNKLNFLKVHGILSEAFLTANQQGKIRKEQVGVRDSKTMKPVYIAVEPEFMSEELTKLFVDITLLLERDLSYYEVYYFASMIHLWIAKIHPFTDGNGRSARLLEKWFLASKLGSSAWSIQSELFYWENRSAYYQNIALGYNYYALHWERCVPFLLMLPEALENQ